MKLLFKFIFLPIAAILVFLTVLLTTSIGAKTGFWTINLFLPGKLTAEGIKGSLVTQLEIEQLYYLEKEHVSAINDLTLNWSLYDFLIKRASPLSLEINKFSSSSALLHLQGTAVALTGTLTLPEITTPHWELTLTIPLIELASKEMISFYDTQFTSKGSAEKNTSQLISKIGNAPDKNATIKLLIDTNQPIIDINLKGTSHSSSIHAYGQFNLLDNQRLQWQWNAAIKDLGDWLPEAKGSLNSEGKVTGDLNRPHVKAKLQGKNLAFTDYSVTSINGHAEINDSLSGELNVDNIVIGNQVIQAFNIKGHGKLIDHQIIGNINHSQGNNLKTTLQGSYQKESWQAKISELTINSKALGQWLLEKQFLINVTKNDLDINNFCLNNAAQLICLSSQGNPDHWQATLDTKQFNLTPFAALFLENIDWHWEGMLDLAAKINYQHQEISAASSIHIPQFAFPQQNISITDIKGDIKTNKGKIHYQINGQYNNTPLQLSGETNQQSPYTTKATLSGDKLLLINTETYKIHAVPNLQLESHDNVIKLSGELIIPNAHIYIPSLDDSEITLTSDAVLVTDSDKANDNPLEIYTDLAVGLGEEVTIDIYGLKGQLIGKLQIMDNPRQPTTAKGQLTIKDGAYVAYGQNLTINQGQLLFTGGVIDNPGINFKASRAITTNPQNITAVGIIAAGRVQDPVIRLFAEPPTISQTDILSYLLTGRSSQELDKANAQLLLQAANALNLGDSSYQDIKQDLQNSLGLDTLEVTQVENSYAPQKNAFGNTALLLGKRLSPKLYISYSIGVFGATNTLKANYQLGKHWELQTETTGDNSGADIFYTLESSQ